MKKFLVFTICILFAFLIPFSVYAEEETTVGTSESTLETTVTPTETVPDGNESASDLLSVKFKEWVLPHLEEISVVITLILTAFYNMRKHKLLNKSIGTMNNNTVAIAESSSNMMSEALNNISSTANIVTQYDARIAAMLEAHQATAEDKERLEKELTEMKKYLKTAADANLEFSNELAELLALANIPNYKKEELGARHVAAVNSIKTAESEAILLPEHTEEASEDVGEKA